MKVYLFTIVILLTILFEEIYGKNQNNEKLQENVELLYSKNLKNKNKNNNKSNTHSKTESREQTTTLAQTKEQTQTETSKILTEEEVKY